MLLILCQGNLFNIAGTFIFYSPCLLNVFCTLRSLWQAKMSLDIFKYFLGEQYPSVDKNHWAVCAKWEVWLELRMGSEAEYNWWKFFSTMQRNLDITPGFRTKEIALLKIITAETREMTWRGIESRGMLL